MRFLDYLQAPCDPDLVKHLFTETGLSERDQAIAWAFRKRDGDIEFYADLAGLPRKKFMAVSAGIFRRLMTELIRLAEIGLRYERKQKSNSA